MRYYVYDLKRAGNTTSEVVGEILEGLYNASMDINDYAGAFLAINYIYSTYQLSGLKSVINDNAYGIAPVDETIVHNLSGETSFSKFKTNVINYATNYIENLWPDIGTSSIINTRSAERE